MSRNRRITHWPGAAPTAAPPPPPPTPGAWQAISRTSRRTLSWQSSEAAPPPLPSIHLRFVAAPSSGSPQASVPGLRWAFFDSTDFPALLAAAPVDSGTATTDASGLFSVQLPHTTLAPGQDGWLIVTNSNGTSTQIPPSLAFCAPVKVA